MPLFIYTAVKNRTAVVSVARTARIVKRESAVVKNDIYDVLKQTVYTGGWIRCFFITKTGYIFYGQDSMRV